MRHTSFQTAIKELQKLSSLKEDYLVKAHSLMMLDDGRIEIPAHGLFKGTDHFHSQLSDKLKIPRQYYDRMLTSEENKFLLAINANHWLRKFEKRHLVRTYKGTEGIARAILSDSYKPIENEDILNALLEAITPNYIIDEFNLDDKNFYISVVSDVEINAKEMLKNYSANEHALIGGFIIRNSEVGAGAFEIMARAVIKVCNNGLLVKDDSFRKVHLGAKLDESFWSQRTREQNKRLIVSQIKDYASRFCSKDFLVSIVEKYSAFNQEAKNPTGLVERVGKEVKIDAELLKRYLYKRGDFSYFGIAQSVTESAQVLPTGTQQFEAEEKAYQLLPSLHKWDSELSKN